LKSFEKEEEMCFSRSFDDAKKISFKDEKEISFFSLKSSEKEKEISFSRSFEDAKKILLLEVRREREGDLLVLAARLLRLLRRDLPVLLGPKQDRWPARTPSPRRR
jgi:hypothetical protein